MTYHILSETLNLTNYNQLFLISYIGGVL